MRCVGAIFSRVELIVQPSWNKVAGIFDFEFNHGVTVVIMVRGHPHNICMHINPGVTAQPLVALMKDVYRRLYKRNVKAMMCVNTTLQCFEYLSNRTEIWVGRLTLCGIGQYFQSCNSCNCRNFGQGV